MNKRARNRLVGVTAIILIAIAAIIFSTGGGYATPTVAQLVKDTSLVGKNVSVGGPVVPGSWDKHTNPMKFQISDTTTGQGPKVQVVYNGAAPATFGDGTSAMVQGKYVSAGVVQAQSLQTKCPATYESAAQATTVEQLLGSKQVTSGKAQKVAGTIVAGSIKPDGSPVRFQIQSASGGTKLSVSFPGALADGVKDGAKVVVTGALDPNDVLVATAVALDFSTMK